MVLDKDVSLEVLRRWALLRIGIETFLDEADKLRRDLLL